MGATTALTIAAFLLALVPAPTFAQTVVVPSPLTFEEAGRLAVSRNLPVEAARRQRTIREAAARSAGERPNPDVSVDAARDTPHQSLTFGIPLEIGGMRKRRIDLALEESELADVDFRTAMVSMQRQLRESFYSLRAGDEHVRLAETSLEIARRVRDAAQARFDSGAAPRLEVLQAELGVTRAETDVDLIRSERAAAQAKLNAVLNLPPAQELTVTGPLFSEGWHASYENLISGVAAFNVDVRSLDRRIAIEQRRLELLKAQRVPTPIFSVGADFNAPGEFRAGPRAGISIGLPFFSRNQGEIAESIATTSQLRIERDAAERRVSNAVYGLVARVEASRKRVEAYEQRLVPAATDLEALSEESYQSGRTSVLGVLDAQRNLRDLSENALQAALDLQFALAELEELLGQPLPY